MIEQSAGLAEEHIFGILSRFCNINGADNAVIIKIRNGGAEQIFYGRNEMKKCGVAEAQETR